MSACTNLSSVETGGTSREGEAPDPSAVGPRAGVALDCPGDRALSETATAVTSGHDPGHDQCAQANESRTETVAGIECLCGAVLKKAIDNQTELAATVWTLIEKLATAATAEAEAAAQSARAEAHKEIADLHACVDRLQAERDAERDKLTRALDAKTQEQHARERAEAAWKQAESLHQQSVAAYESQSQALHDELQAERAKLSDLKQQFDIEKAERDRVVAALRTVQRVASLVKTVDAAPDLTSGSIVGQTGEPADVEPDSEAGQREAEPDHPAAEAKTAIAPAANRVLTLVSSGHPSSAELRLLLTEYAKQLLDQAEEMYWVDLRSGRPLVAVVDRLTANLQYARNVFAHRLDSTTLGEMRLFEQQVTVLLDTNAETSFGRHLAIAAYEEPTSQAAPPPPRAAGS